MDPLQGVTPPSTYGDATALQAAHSGGNPPDSAFVAVVSGGLAPDLARLVVAWPSLPKTTRSIILAMAGHVEDAERGRGRP